MKQSKELPPDHPWSLPENQRNAGLLARVCLKTGEMLDYWLEMRDFKEKTARKAAAFRGFLTPKAPVLVKTDSISEF